MKLSVTIPEESVLSINKKCLIFRKQEKSEIISKGNGSLKMFLALFNKQNGIHHESNIGRFSTVSSKYPSSQLDPGSVSSGFRKIRSIELRFSENLFEILFKNNSRET